MDLKLRSFWYVTLTVLLLSPAPAMAQTGAIIGVVTDAESGRPVASARVEAQTITGRSAASILTNAEGRYRLTVPTGQYTVLVETVGYEVVRQTAVSVPTGGSATVDIGLRTAAFALNPVLVSASRRQERATDAPARVEVISEQDIRARPAVTPVDHLRSTPGLDVITQGVQSSNVAARGFNNIFSGSLHMLTDHRLAGVPSLRVNVMHFMPATNEDLQRMEVVLGPGAALYGPNTASGVLHMITKSPLTSTGTTFSVMGGERDMLSGSFRTAQRLTDNVGFKVSGSLMQATDFPYTDPDEVAERAKFAADPFFRQDLINTLGDRPDAAAEADRRIAGIGNRTLDIRRWSGEARMDINVTPELRTVLQTGITNAGTGIELTGLGAGRIDNWRYQYYQARMDWNRLFAQVYLNTSDAGDTYLLRTGQPIVDKSRLMVAQAQHGLRTWSERQGFTYGVDYFFTDPRTEGTISGRYEDDDRTQEFGAYLQSETRISPQFDVVLAGRVDTHNALPDAIFSPRAALIFKPAAEQSVRLTYNRAFSTPTSLNQFLDLSTSVPDQTTNPANAAAARLGYSVRVQGTGTTGFNFQQNGAFQMRSPFSPALGIGPASTLVPANAAAFFPAAVAVLAQGGAFNANPQLGGYLATLRPTAAQVGTNFLQDGQSIPLASLTLQNIAPIRETTTTSYEVGYKGVLQQRFSVAADVYFSRIQDFVTPLTVSTPLLGLNPQQLGAYLVQMFMTPQAQGGLGMPQQQAVATANALVPNFARIPLGVISSAEVSSTGAQLLATYTNVDEAMDLWGMDLSVQALLTPMLSLTVGGSLVGDDYFDTSVGIVTLNAPKRKGTVALEYRDQNRGFNGELRARYNAEFPVRSGVYQAYSCVDPDAVSEECVSSYTLLDLNVGYTLPQMRGATLQLAVQNLLDEDYRSFPGVPNIGRFAMLRLRYEF
jgi:outer membrane receptor for ferrienterochelin and colicins